MSLTYEVPGELTKPEFMLITLSQLPALSILLKGSMATRPGHVSLFAMAHKWKMKMAGTGRLERPRSTWEPVKGQKRRTFQFPLWISEAQVQPQKSHGNK